MSRQRRIRDETSGSIYYNIDELSQQQSNRELEGLAP